VSIEDLQKKLIPWHSLMPKEEDLDNNAARKKPQHLTKPDGLVLVSSLIEKGTNLGGICRTCEIFNVRELVVGSIKYLEDKLFQNLSVTAEKWLSIKEVSVKYLKTYMLEMKYAGFSLIGLEQTANSVKLNEFSFPSNSLLILGFVWLFFFSQPFRFHAFFNEFFIFVEKKLEMKRRGCPLT
jgi:tRNA guanosine-2'-O-methyltransferase